MSKRPGQLKDVKNLMLPVKTASVTAASSSSALGITLVISLASIIIVGVLMRSASVQVWSDDSGGWRDTEFDAAASRFQTHVMLAHVEWIRLGGPREVLLEVRGNTFTRVPMGANGWPIGLNGETSGVGLCNSVWEVLAEPGDMRKSLRAEWGAQGGKNFCYFYYDDVLRFRYQPSNGQIYHEPKPK